MRADGSSVVQPKVWILSSIRLFREGLSHQLQRDGRLRLAGTGAPTDKILAELLTTRPSAIALDLTGGSSLRFAEELHGRAPEIKLIGFAIGEQDVQLAAWARTGVCGYVEEEGTIDDIVTAVLRALRGELHCTPRFAARLFAQLTDPPSPLLNAGAIQGNLTAREHEILREIELGASNKEIARRLGISVATVKNHVHRLLEKLHVSRRAQACAMMRGQIPPA